MPKKYTLDFSLERHSLSDICLEYRHWYHSVKYDTLVYGAQYYFSNRGDYTELSVASGIDNYTHENILKHICKKHNLNSSQIELKKKQQSGPWVWYRVEFDWEKHIKWAKPIIEDYRIEMLAEELSEYSTADLLKVIKRRKLLHEDG